jgi:hypothetical protein
MAVTSTRTETITFSGDGINSTIVNSAAVNTASPGQVDIVSLNSGANTITPPAGGSTPKAVTIVPPAGNVNTIIIKGIAGDTGVVLHLTDPSTVALNSAVTTFVLNAAASITGVRLIWS